jgi:hypothetical protein
MKHISNMDLAELADELDKAKLIINQLGGGVVSFDNKAEIDTRILAQITHRLRQLHDDPVWLL